jgi:hypothetical protein
MNLDFQVRINADSTYHKISVLRKTRHSGLTSPASIYPCNNE